MRDVCINKCDMYELNQLVDIFENQFRQLGINSKIKPGMTVVIKPNLVIKADSESGIITHPTLVAAVGIIVKSLGARVLIAESSGGVFTEQSVRYIMSACGYSDIAEQYGFEIYTACKNASVELKNGKICKRLNVIEPYINADFIIDIAKLKTHCMTMISGSVKNLFGVVPGLMKPELHFRFPEKPDFSAMLVDLCEYIQPDLCIIDAIDCMEGNGPTGGVKKHLGLIISSENPYCADIAAAEIIGFDPMDIYMLSDAHSRGLCPADSGEINVIGEKLVACKVSDFKMPTSKDIDFAKRVPKLLQPFVKKISTPKPVIDKKHCVGCGKCAESCPKHTINISQHVAVIDYDNCIRCFCCHEMCPMHVIDVRRFNLFNL